VRTAWVLQFYAAGLWAFCAQHMLLRGFYAMHDTRTPLKVSLVTVGTSIALNLVLVWTPLRAGTFGLTTTVTAAGSVLLLALLLRRKLEGRLDLRAILRSIAKTAVATAAMAIVAGLTLYLGRDWWGDWARSEHGGHLFIRSTHLLVSLLDVMLPMAAGGVAFLAAAYVLRSDELKELLGLRRIRRSAQ